MGLSKATKSAWFVKLEANLEQYKSVFIVEVDNVSSNQMHQIRAALRGKAEIQMGKNTMVRKALRDAINSGSHPEYERLLPYVKGNVGFVFTNDDLKTIRDTIVSNRVAAPARAGAIALNDVSVPAGNTGMEPGKTSFFQALGIPTKIARGTIEITAEVKLIKAGDKVGASEATLLNVLNISPFTYGMNVAQVFQDGNIFESSVLDVTNEDLLARFMSSVSTITCVSLALNYPTLPSVSHTVVNAYKNLLAIAIATEIEFEHANAIRERLANPEAYASAAPAAAASSDDKAGSKPEAAEAKAESESDDDDFGLDLFG